MKKSLSTSLIIGASALALAACGGSGGGGGGKAGEYKVKPGEWEMTMKVSMGDNPMPEQVETDCITEEEATYTVDSLLEQVSDGQSGECAAEDVVANKNDLSFKMVCGEGAEGVTGDMKFTFISDTEMKIEGSMEAMGGMLQIGVDGTGKHVGECEA